MYRNANERLLLYSAETDNIISSAVKSDPFPPAPVWYRRGVSHKIFVGIDK